MKKVERILKYLEGQGISVSEFERESGLSNTYLKKTAERGADLSQKILDRIRDKNPKAFDYIFKNGDNIVLVETKGSVGGNKEPLESAIEKLAEAELINARSIERLINLLEAKTLQLPQAAGSTTENLLRQKEKAR